MGATFIFPESVVFVALGPLQSVFFALGLQQPNFALNLFFVALIVDGPMVSASGSEVFFVPTKTKRCASLC